MTTSVVLPPNGEQRSATTDSRLSTHWTPVRRFSSFYDRGRPVYNEEHQALFCLRNDSICVVDYSSSAILATIGGIGDSITAFAVNGKGDTIVAGCSSLLFRVYQLNWEHFRRVRAENIHASGFEGLYATSPLVVGSANSTSAAREAGCLLPAREIRSWKGPVSLIRCLTISSLPGTSPLVAAGCVDGSLYVYDLRGGYCTQVFRKHTSSVGMLRFHPSRLLLLSTSEDGEIRAHDLYRHITVAHLCDHLSLPTDIDFVLPNNDATAESPIGGFISASRDQVVNIWSLDCLDDQLSQKVVATALRLKLVSKKTSGDVRVRVGLPPIETERRVAADLHSKDDAKRQRQKKSRTQPDAAVSEDAALKQVQNWWSDQHDGDAISTLSPLHQMATHESVEAVLCVSSRLLSGCRIQSTGGDELADTNVSELCPWIIVTAGDTGLLAVWNPQTRKRIATLHTPHTGRGTIHYLGTHTSPAGIPWLISAASDHNIVFWNLRSFKIDRLLLGSGTELIHCQFLNVPPMHSLAYHDVQGLAPDEGAGKSDSSEAPFQRALLLRSDPDCAIVEMSAGRTSASLLSGHTDTVLSADATPEGCWIATGSKDHSVRLWNACMETCVAVLHGHTAPVVAVQTHKSIKQRLERQCTCLSAKSSGSSAGAESRSGELMVVSVCLEGVLKVWTLDPAPLRERVRTLADQHRTTTVFSQDSAHEPLYTDHFNRSAPIAVTQAAHSVSAHDKEINALTVAPNDKCLATGSSDKTIKVWSLPALALLGTCRGHTRPIWSLKFSPVEKVLASGSADHTIRLWSLKDFSCLKTFQGHQSSVLGLDFLTVGTQLVSCAGDGQLKLWNIRTSDCVSSFDHHQGEKVWSIAVNNSGTSLISASADHQLLIWNDTTDETERLEAEKSRQEAADLLEIDALARSGKTLDALTLTLRRRRPFQTRTLLEQSYERGLFQKLDADADANTGKATGVGQLLTQHLQTSRATSSVTPEELGEWISNLSDDQLKTLLEFIVKWNANGHTSNLANTLLHLILQYIPSESLIRVEGFRNLAAAFLAYVPRHGSRTAALLQRTYILDMILLTSGVKSVSDMPDLPQRVGTLCKTDTEVHTPSQHIMSPLSVEDAYTTLFE